MKLSEMKLENLRSFEQETILFDDHTCLVGPNGVGKSTVFTALNIFFRDSSSSATRLDLLGTEDFHSRDTSKPIRVTVTFTDLSPEAQNDFKAYYRQNKLVITAVAPWDAASGSAEVKQYGVRSVMTAFSDFFKAEADKAKVAELRAIYQGLQKQFADLPGVTTP